MKILYDYQVFESQKHGGVSRYFFALISQFPQSPNLSYSLPIKYSGNVYLKTLPEFKNIISGGSDYYEHFMGGVEFKGKTRLFNLRNNLLKNAKIKINTNKQLSIKAIEQNEFDIFHPTYYNPYFLNHLTKKPFVVTVHDMIHELHNECFDPKDATSSYKKLLCTKAKKIISVSENTKSDLINLFEIDANKIEVIHHGSSLNTQASNSAAILNFSYLLFVGNRTLYKNFNFYIESIANILKQNNLQFICAGSSPFSPSEIALIKKLGLENNVKHIVADDSILINLYQNALAFIFPSLYEGFGIPVLEAFACNCPCILSTGGSLPEVGGEAALYFNPKDSDSIQSVLLEFLSNSNIKSTLIEKGKERLKQFSWEKTFDQTINLYKSIL